MNKITNVIGIAGTAKNTGKTTTLNCLLKEAADRNLSVAVTGIGFDGEEQDNVTLLPKPRVIVYPNSIVTTSEQCLEISTATVEILHRTGMFTSLGEILILRILQTGLIIIAGPSKRKELESIIKSMEHYNVDCIFVDGSLNRISPMSVVNSIIFTTGASRSTDIEFLCREMKAIEYIFSFPVISNISDSDTIDIPLLLDDGDVDRLKPKFTKKTATLFVSKMISLRALERLISHCANGSIQLQKLIFPDPFALMMNENIFQAYSYIVELTQLNISISYQKAPILSCITANPFFPQYVGNKYYPKYVDRIELIKQLRTSCSLSIFDTQEAEPSKIFNSCFR